MVAPSPDTTVATFEGSGSSGNGVPIWFRKRKPSTALHRNARDAHPSDADPTMTVPSALIPDASDRRVWSQPSGYGTSRSIHPDELQTAATGGTPCAPLIRPPSPM